MNHWIAESGSTKTDWACYQGPAAGARFASAGINPSYATPQAVDQALALAITSGPWATSTVASLIWYGAGCQGTEPNAVMQQALHKVWPGAQIAVCHDLLAAARAALGAKQGLVAILGTGSHACYYSGNAIGQQAVNLGYLLGDEGGGADLGKRLLQAFFYNNLPGQEASFIQDALLLTRDQVINKLYRQPGPQTWLASLAKILAQRPYLRAAIAQPALATFIKTHVLPLAHATGVNTLGAVGSIAAYFKPELEAACGAQITLLACVASPVEELVHFHEQHGFLA